MLLAPQLSRPTGFLHAGPLPVPGLIASMSSRSKSAGGTEAGGSDDEHLSTCGSETTISTSHGVMQLVEGCKGLVCKLCRANSTDPCPLEGGDSAKWCGLWPWSKYVRAGTDGNEKKPAGRICAICLNVFNSLGLSAKYESVGAYWKFVTVAANPHEHAKFLASVKVWIKLYNDNPGSVRIRNKSALETAQTTQEVVTSKGGRFKKQKNVCSCGCLGRGQKRRLDR